MHSTTVRLNLTKRYRLWRSHFDIDLHLLSQPFLFGATARLLLSPAPGFFLGATTSLLLSGASTRFLLSSPARLFFGSPARFFFSGATTRFILGPSSRLLLFPQATETLGLLLGFAQTTQTLAFRLLSSYLFGSATTRLFFFA